MPTHTHNVYTNRYIVYIKGCMCVWEGWNLLYIVRLLKKNMKYIFFLPEKKMKTNHNLVSLILLDTIHANFSFNHFFSVPNFFWPSHYHSSNKYNTHTHTMMFVYCWNHKICDGHIHRKQKYL